MRVIVFVLLSIVLTHVSAKRRRAEVILAEALMRPLVPREFASPECIRDGEIYLKALEKYDPWALEMYDASVKIPSSVITGDYKQLGNFDECLQVKNRHGFIGQACNVGVEFEIAEDDDTPRHELDIGDLLTNVAIASNATKWRFGSTVVYEWMSCVPSTCNHTEIREAVEFALDELNVEGRVDMIVSVPQESCHTVKTVQESKIWDSYDYCYALLLIMFAIIIIASTGYDMAIQRGMITKSRAILTSFSLYKNGKNLLRTDRQQKSIGCLDGLRFLSICWIIYGHTYYMEAMGIKINLTQIPKMHHYWNSMLVLNGNIVTDTFFLLSGILLAYTELLRKEKTGSKWRFDVAWLYFRRYIRLTPAYALMIGFYATLFYKFGTGLHWDYWVGINKNFCRENWWTNLIYLNNHINVSNMCMSQSWYLSTDMQLVWLSPLVLYPMLKLRRIFFAIVLGICLFVSILVPFVITYAHKLTGTMLYYKEQEDLARVYLEIYTKVYSRFGPYVIGLALGYILYKKPSQSIKLSVRCVILGWLVATVSGLLVIFGPRGMYFDNYVYNRLQASFYAGFHRHVFALSVSWIIFCCVHGYAGPINGLLSWRGWIPLSKLTYCAYLCHYVFLLSDFGAIRTAGTLTTMNVARSFFANLMLTMILAILWSLCFEMPFMTIERSLKFQSFKSCFSQCKRKSSKDKQNYDTTEFDKEVCRSQKLEISCYNSMGTVGDHENGVEVITKKINKKNEIYVVNSDVNSDNRRTNYVNVDFYRTYEDEDESPRTNR